MSDVQKVFRIGGAAALVLGALAALAAATVVVIGALALAGRVAYPAELDLGPFSISDEVSMPVALGADVCQTASVAEQPAPSDCFRFFMHEPGWPGDQAVRHQDADVRPTSALLTGKVTLATTGGWSAVVATQAALKAIGLLVISAGWLLLGRLLADMAADYMSSARAVRHARGFGWLFIVGGVVHAILSLLASAATGGYTFESFGGGPSLDRVGDAGIDLAPIALGALVLLLAEAFRRSVAVEAEPAGLPGNQPPQSR